MMSKNSIVPFLKDYLIKFLTRPFLLDTNDLNIRKFYIWQIYKIFIQFYYYQPIKGHKKTPPIDGVL